MCTESFYYKRCIRACTRTKKKERRIYHENTGVCDYEKIGGGRGRGVHARRVAIVSFRARFTPPASSVYYTKVLPALFHLWWPSQSHVTRTEGSWTHTSDDSYIYQLSLDLATDTVYFLTPYRKHETVKHRLFYETYFGLINPKLLRPHRSRVIECEEWFDFHATPVLCTSFVKNTI